MAAIIHKSAGKDGCCDEAQISRRGWRKVLIREPTCIAMLPQKNKNDPEIWLPQKYCEEEKESPPTDEELNHLSRLFTQERDQMTDEQVSLLVRSIPSSHFQALLGISSEKHKQKISSDVVSIPFEYEDGGDSEHNCGICGKKGHTVLDCSYWNFIPLGVNVGPKYFVKCKICLQKISQPVGVCHYCGSDGGGVAVMKVCIHCLRYGEHMSEECSRLEN